MPGTRAAATHPIRTLISGEETDERLALLEVLESPGSELPLHIHSNEDEIIYILAGELTVSIGAELRPARAGDCFLLPRGVEHGYAVTSADARLLISLIPAGLEPFFQELAAQQGQNDIERLITTAARYGIEITGPVPVN